MNGVSPLKHGFVDLAAIFFVIGGVVGLMTSLLMIPISSIYPSFTLASALGTSVLIVLAVGLVCSLGAIHCYSLTSRRLLSEAGIRGVIFGAVLLILSLGLVGTFMQSGTMVVLMAIGAVLVLIAGATCFVLRHTDVSASAFAHQRALVQQT